MTEKKKMLYAEVILPLPLANSYTYIVPDEMQSSLAPGCRVIVHFGAKRYYTAIVIAVHEDIPPVDYELKEIYVLLDDAPVLREPQLAFWRWIASYYICKLGDVYKAALPAGLKLESETAVTYNAEFEAEGPLRPAQQAVLDAFGDVSRLTVGELERKTGLKNVVSVVSSLMACGAVVVSEELKRGYVPRKAAYIRLAEAFRSEESLQTFLDGMRQARKQEQLLLRFLELTGVPQGKEAVAISKKELLAKSGCSAAILKELLRKGVLESFEKEIPRIEQRAAVLQELPVLSELQHRAFQSIKECFRSKNVCLLHGVTSSGKTDIYIHFIDEVLKQGQQVLYMLPEIAITTQIMERLSRYFGDRLLVYHSKFSDNERVEVWNRLLHSDEPVVVLGVRSSLFLPFARLGLIIVDEEHEGSYKQQDPAPRYHARNAAIVLAGMHGAKTLLGSATPSIDSYFNAQTGKYGLVELNVRYGNCPLPEVKVVNIRELKRRKQMKNALFSPVLIEEMRRTLAAGEQVILFQNRRGFSPVMECGSCGYVPHCVNCDVSLTYHKYRRELVCHYCGYKMVLPDRCPDCGADEWQPMGFGTEKVEEEIASLFPGVKVGRMDVDTVHTRSAYEKMIAAFEGGEYQIMIGTQMLSKGLDFGKVSLVGILNADMLMNYPDFRAHERAFQLMVQVAGRAGRRDKQGTVVLQTSHPETPLIGMVQTFDYKQMAALQMGERSMFHYPPYYRLIVVVLRGRNEAVLSDCAKRHADRLFKLLGNRVLGPVTPPVTRVQNWFIRHIILKIEIKAGIAPLRELLEQVHGEMLQYQPYRQLLVHYDVDPL